MQTADQRTKAADLHDTKEPGGPRGTLASTNDPSNQTRTAVHPVAHPWVRKTDFPVHKNPTTAIPRANDIEIACTNPSSPSDRGTLRLASATANVMSMPAQLRSSRLIDTEYSAGNASRTPHLARHHALTSAPEAASHQPLAPQAVLRDRRRPLRPPRQHERRHLNVPIEASSERPH